MQELPKLNERLIAQALEHIRLFPESYIQNTIIEQTEVTKETPCGAIGCFGGWIKLLSIPKTKRHDEAPGLDDNTSLQEAGDLVGFTESERDYVFSTTDTDSPKKNYKTIVKRLKEVRAARAKILSSKYYRGHQMIEEAREKNEDDVTVLVDGDNASLDYSDLFD